MADRKSVEDRRAEQDAGSIWQEIGGKTFRLIEDGGLWSSGAHRSHIECLEDYRKDRLKRRKK